MKVNLKNGEVKALYRYPEKGMPAVTEDKMVFEKSMGIVGDHHADGGERQISIVTVSERAWMEKQTVKGFCFKKYKENMLLDGMDLAGCQTGDLLKCGDVVLELTGVIKSCYPDLCKFAEHKDDCILAGSSRFAKVRAGGTIEVGMSVEIIRED